MTYIDFFNQLDQQISDRIEILRKEQEKLLEQKKHLSETKQKIYGFLSDAQEMKQLLDFQPELVNFVYGELTKIFSSQDLSQNNLIQTTDLKSNLTFQPPSSVSTSPSLQSSPSSQPPKSPTPSQPPKSPTPSQPEPELVENNYSESELDLNSDLDLELELDLDLEPQVILDEDERELINKFQFVDADGKDTSF